VIWLFENLAGICPDIENPGFKHIVMRPEPVGDLRFVKASFLSPYGPIKSYWSKEDDKFNWQVTIPANTTATVYVPADSADAVLEGGKPAGDSEGVKFVRMDDGRAVFTIGSGDYHFEVK
jgi:alpha-L-rhamnosidase